MKANQTLHGLEYELQLMLETEKGLEIVNAEAVLKGKQRIFPKNVGLDMGNIEIRTKLEKNCQLKSNFRYARSNSRPDDNSTTGY